MHLKSTRTYLEARVGAFHSVEILLHVRRQDLPWFNEQQASSTRELFSILQRSILPRMFATEIEVSHAKETGKQLPPPLGPGGLPIEVGETNLRLQQQQKNAKKRRKLTKKQLAAEVARREKEEDKKEKDVYHAFGTTMQLTYRLEDEPKRKPPVTLLFRESGKEDQSFRGPSGRGRGDMQRLIKLSKRLIIWCYPYDTSQSIEPDPPGGMLRPEMVPMSELFRESRNEISCYSRGTHKQSVRMLTGSRSLFLMVLCLLTTGLVNASTPSEHRASQLAIGEWDIVLKCSRDIYESVLFPHVKAREPSALVPRLKDIAPQVYPCRLCIFANSTFCLEPRDTGGWYRQSFQDPHLNSIRGKWKAKPNPYCATDRYFDEIMLSSLSRVERQLPKKVGPWPWARKNEMLLKKIKFHLSCRLYGQFWDSSRSTGHILDGNEKYVRGRMSHGVLVTDQMDGADKPSEWWRKRVIAGSFAGRRRRQVIDIDDEPNQKGKAEKSR